ncbi:helix-turn-helix domain-containing protein [Allocatelliglobosispora scoriae]|uniref:helix-turn-helix domain-containing protein n=1 Tax=Allocatelliglobosispora scoriae TaxID=643052 RepID=UPI0035E44650
MVEAWSRDPGRELESWMQRRADCEDRIVGQPARTRRTSSSTASRRSTNEFGRALRAARVNAGMSLRVLARHLHYSSGYLSKVENGQSPSGDLARSAGVLFGDGGALMELWEKEHGR